MLIKISSNEIRNENNIKTQKKIKSKNFERRETLSYCGFFVHIHTCFFVQKCDEINYFSAVFIILSFSRASWEIFNRGITGDIEPDVRTYVRTGRTDDNYEEVNICGIVKHIDNIFHGDIDSNSYDYADEIIMRL